MGGFFDSIAGSLGGPVTDYGYGYDPYADPYSKKKNDLDTSFQGPSPLTSPEPKLGGGSSEAAPLEGMDQPQAPPQQAPPQPPSAPSQPPPPPMVSPAAAQDSYTQAAKTAMDTFGEMAKGSPALSQVADLRRQEQAIQEKPPSAWRQVLAGFVPGPIAPVVAYGPKGLQQRQQKARLEQDIKNLMPQAQAEELSLQRRMQGAEGITRLAEGEQQRQTSMQGVGERQYASQLNTIKGMKGEPLPPGDPVPEGWSAQSVNNPLTNKPETYIIPSRATLTKLEEDKKQAGWIPLPPTVAKSIGMDPNTKVDPNHIPAYLNAASTMSKAGEKTLQQSYVERQAVVDDLKKKGYRIDPRDELSYLTQGKFSEYPPGMSQDHGQNVFDTSGKMIRLQPGQTAPPGAVTAQGMNTVNTPTTAMRGRGEMAASVIQQAPSILGQIDSLKTKLGPGVGRWNELWVNKGGMDDPDFAGLDQDLKMYASGVAIAHFGYRGGQTYREALENNFGEAQSPDDLKSRVEHADKWLEGYATAAGKGTAKTPTPQTTDSKLKAYADQYFGGDITKAQAAIDQQRKKKK